MKTTYNAACDQPSNPSDVDQYRSYVHIDVLERYRTSALWPPGLEVLRVYDVT
jgi:hypothetical protein